MAMAQTMATKVTMVLMMIVHRNHSSSHYRKPRWLPLDEIGDKDKLGRPIMMTRVTMIAFIVVNLHDDE